jgi:glycosyltransferase involved in cell wall biosynthesis
MSALNNNYATIVVDDGSTDNLSQVMEHLPVQFIRHERNKGVAAARNTGIKEVKTPWFISLDADDFLMPGVLDKAIQYSNDADVIYGDYVTKGGNVIKPPMASWQTVPTAENWKAQNLIFNTSLVRKTTWENVGGYVEEIDHYEDWLFWAKCSLAGARFVYANLAFYCYNGMGQRSDYQRRHAALHDENYRRLLDDWLAQRS